MIRGQSRFASYTRAGLALSRSQSDEPLDLWLHYVFLDLLEHKSELLSPASQEGGIIVRACEASAIYCARLERKVLESEGGKRHLLKPPSSIPKELATKKPGRAPTRAPEFVAFAGGLWLQSIRQNNQTKVSNLQLSQIGAKLDEKGYIPPTKFLEKRCADELKTFNSRNSNSKSGAIKTWSQLVTLADKDHLRGMRRLLSRCAKNQLLR